MTKWCLFQAVDQCNRDSPEPWRVASQGGDCIKKMQREVASVHTKLSVSKSNLFDRESVETPLLTCLSPTLPVSTENCSSQPWEEGPGPSPCSAAELSGKHSLPHQAGGCPGSPAVLPAYLSRAANDTQGSKSGYGQRGKHTSGVNARNFYSNNSIQFSCYRMLLYINILEHNTLYYTIKTVMGTVLRSHPFLWRHAYPSLPLGLETPTPPIWEKGCSQWHPFTLLAVEEMVMLTRVSLGCTSRHFYVF